MPSQNAFQGGNSMTLLSMRILWRIWKQIKNKEFGDGIIRIFVLSISLLATAFFIDARNNAGMT